MPYHLSYRREVPPQIRALAGRDLYDAETWSEAVGIRDASVYGPWMEIVHVPAPRENTRRSWTQGLRRRSSGE